MDSITLSAELASATENHLRVLKKREQTRAAYLRNIEYKRSYSKAYYQTRKDDPKYKAAQAVRSRRSHIKNKEKRRNHKYMERYGITFDQKMAILSKQNSQCKACGKLLKLDHPRDVHVDHDHRTGKVRGILCHRCNTVLGWLEDDVLMGKLRSYLQKGEDCAGS